MIRARHSVLFLSVSLFLTGQLQAQTYTTVSEKLPNASLFYDYDADGKKEFFSKPDDFPFVFEDDTIWEDRLFVTESYSGSFRKKAVLSTKDIKPLYFFEDINNDGIIDMTGLKSGDNPELITTLCSGKNGYTLENNKFIIPGCDLNNDGRIDFLSFDMWHVNEHSVEMSGPAPDGTGFIRNNKIYINYRQSNGSVKTERMQIVTQDEYESRFNPDAWASSTSWNGLITPSRGFNAASAGLGAVSLARAPMRISSALRAATSDTPRRAGSMGTYVSVPTKALDLNGDGLMDLTDEKNGIIYFNTGDGRWIMNDVGGQVITADFNGDGIQDYIFPGQSLELLVYTGAGEFNKQILYRNVAVDKDIYCYDFDHDGDVDILVTFSAPLNRTENAYTMFFTNDGNGNFTQKEEQDYGDLKLYFTNCQDVDGDGYMDMLAFNFYKPEYCEYYRGEDLVQQGNSNWFANGGFYFLKGKSDMTFSEPVKLFDWYEPHWQKYDAEYDGNRYYFYGATVDDLSKRIINVEDIDNDGKLEIWMSEAEMGEYGYLDGGELDSCGYQYKYYRMDTAADNNAPIAPEKPSVIYENGWLIVNWGEGDDAETQTIDLTYALRIGTTSGGSDIVHADANADGSRRNFLDGNMLKNHSYSIDLRSYPPSDIYIAVQTIDAQHKGSAWSEEAIVKHNTLPASVVVEMERINLNDTLTLHFTPLPDEYSHQWKVEDGKVVDSDSCTLKICFDKSGSKAITHVLSSANDKAAQYVVNVSVNGIILGETTSMDERTFQLMGRLGYVGAPIMADYNYDGYHDFAYDNLIWRGSENLSITKATGVWNTDVKMDGRWFDWDHNGSADYIYQDGQTYYYLVHNGTGNLSVRQSDDALEWFFNNLDNDNDDYREYASMLLVDFMHDGYYFMFGDKYDNRTGEVEDYVIFKRNQEGKYESHVSLSTEGWGWIEWLSHNKDLNHDGYVDLVGYHLDSNKLSELLFYFNHGEKGLEKVVVPFEKPIMEDDLNGTSFIDFNNDGYYDIFGYRKIDSAPYIIWNNQNLSFSVPYVFPVGDLQSFYNQNNYNTTKYIFADINNDGYIDVFSGQPNSSNNETGLYVFFMGDNGVIDQGFIYPRFTNTRLEQINGKWVAAWWKDNGYEYQNLLPEYENEKPSAPSGVRAVQTADGLLIEWDDAKDDHTPAVQIRYNLSVRHKGQTGAGAFVISPQNGLNSNAAYLPGYEYITATRYEIPISALSVGEYEIQIQALDLLNGMSEFSAPVTIKIDRQVIEAPTVVSIEKEATITYMGESSAATPAWDFDGGTVVSGSGFGPYHVSWNTSGVKTIKLTLNGTVSERLIAIDVNDSQVTLPKYLFEGYSTQVDIPDNMKVQWKLSIDGEVYELVQNGILGNDWEDEICASGNVITVNDALYGRKLVLKLSLTNANGTSKDFEQEIEILTQDESPYISIIDADDAGHNVIKFEALPEYFPYVSILKETNIAGQFMELARVDAIAGSYTDTVSDLSRKAERYALAGIMADGILSPVSKAHMNVHMNVNVGLGNTYNLIWNEYKGAEVATYNILRGSSESSLVQIASVSGSNTSYTDNSSDAGEPYYAIEYILKAGTSKAPQREFAFSRVRERGNGLTGRSNTVNTNVAYKATYVSQLSIISISNIYKLTENRPAVYLYTEVLPINATYQAVEWEIIKGDSLATIENGLLTARNPNTGGIVTVRATAIDGSGVSATRDITVEAFGKIDKYYTIRFVNYDGTELQSSKVLEGVCPEYTGETPSKESSAKYDYTFQGWTPEIRAADAEVSYKAIYTEIVRKYTVTFYNWDDSILQQSEVEYDSVPEYTKAEPTRESDGEYDYTFVGWTEEITPVTGKADYHAKYERTAIEVSSVKSIVKMSNHVMKYIDANGNILLITPDGRKFNLLGLEVK